MRRFLVAAAVPALAVLLLGQTSPPSPDKTGEHPDVLCAVAGRVVTAAEGLPLKSAHVALIPERSRSDDPIYSATSDSDGHFLLKDIPAGRYKFLAVRAGFVEQQYQSRGTADGAVLALNPGQKISDALFRMTRAAVITGSVTNEDGEPLVNAQIVALQKPTEEETEEEGPASSRKHELNPVAESHTDDRGQYRIFGLKPGQYYVKATDVFDPDSNGLPVSTGYWVQQSIGSEYAPVYYPGVGQIGQAVVLLVRPGDEVRADVSMRRIKTVEVDGKVMGLNGPAKSAYVTLEPAEQDNFRSSYQETTDDNGAFKLKGIPPGSYVLVVYQRSEGTEVYEQSTRQKLEVAGDNNQSLTISLTGGVTFDGRLGVAGPASLSLDHVYVGLIATNEDGSWGGQGAVKKDGTFQITSVMDGSYRIALWGLEQGWYVKSARTGAEDILENGLQVEKETAGRLEIVVSSACAQLEGSVMDGDQVAAGARVHLAPEPETPYNRLRLDNARTDQTGHFSIACLAPGKYRVVARLPASPDSDSPKSEPQVVTVSEHDHKTMELKIVKPEAE